MISMGVVEAEALETGALGEGGGRKLSDDARGAETRTVTCGRTKSEGDALMAAYRGTVSSPRGREFIDKALNELMGIGHEGHHAMPGVKPPAHSHPD